ncbi:ATP-dependent Clp protease adapter ClpS [bacterium]|nr:ATP-dependent Clp protease adapter ClpS [bacterium]NBW98606.1 ATP-dependent Clp protease adapter ClpS [bacterium]NBX83185.1 ATP-dependent Clp protease adapter ClpS [bacterium]
MDEPFENETAGGVKTLVKPSEKTKTPSLFKVIILNDDFTPQDYVVHILERFFKKTKEQATELMLQVHKKGMGIAGVYPLEIAETKTFQVNEYSKSHQYPLKCVVEKA